MRAALICLALVTIMNATSDDVVAEGSRTFSIGHIDDGPTDSNDRPEWRRYFPECEPEEATGECRTKTCSYSDSSWSGISECTCNTTKTVKPPPESPLETLRKEWTENRHATGDNQSASANEAKLILLGDSKLWHVNPRTGRSVLLMSLGLYNDARDFAVWQRKQSMILATIGSVDLCSLSVDASGYMDFGCRCDSHCKGRHGAGHVQLDRTLLPTTFHIAVDWVHGLYYWAGHSYDAGAIGVYEIATKRRRVLFNGPSFRPLDIEVDPIAGYIFWIDRERQAVFRADTDGRNMTAIINLIGIRTIALDVNERRVYFIDSIIRHLIASADYFGENVVTILQSCQFVSAYEPALLVLDDSIFWIEGNTLLSVFKHGNGTLPKIHYVAEEKIQALHAWHHSVQPIGVDRCSGHKCAFMCLPRVASDPHSEGVLSDSNGTTPHLPYSCACALGERATWLDGRNLCISDDGGKRHGLAVPL